MSKFVLVEVEEEGEVNDGRIRYETGDGQMVFVKPENVHETPPDVLRAAIELLIDKGYNLRYDIPVDIPPTSQFVSNSLSSALLPCGQDSRVTTNRLIIDPPTPEPEPKLTKERWAETMPRLADHRWQNGAINFQSYDDAKAKWIQGMPE